MGVLLVDDNPEVQDLVSLTLQKSGLSVVSVNDGLSALDCAISEKPDLILADFSIKGIDVSTFIKKIQRRPSLADTPIVLLVEEGKDSDPVALQLASLHAILKKPLDPNLLSHEVKKQLGIAEETVVEEEGLPEKVEEAVDDGEGLSYIPIEDDFFPSEHELFVEQEKIEPIEIEPVPIVSDKPEPQTPKISVEPEKVDEAIRKIVLEVVERVAWEIIPGVVETAMPKGKIQSLVQQVVWEIVPPLAEIEIKKELKRLQPDEGFSESEISND